MSNKNIENNLHLKKQKIKLSFVFSSIIFLILFSLQVFFQTFKYIDYRNSLENRFTEQVNLFTKVQQISKSLPFQMKDMMRPKIIEQFRENWVLPPPENWEKRRLDNFIIFNSLNFSIDNTLIDSDFASEILNNLKINFKKDEISEFSIWWIDYHFLVKYLWNNKSLLIFSEEKLSMDEVLSELSIYFILSLVFSIFLYFIVFSFVNRVLSPVEQNLKDMEDFVHNAGHELKTPISVVKSSLQLAKLKKSYEEEVDESIAELNKMDELINWLLNLTLINKNHENQTCDMQEIINEVLKTYDTKIQEKNINLKIHKNFPLQLKCNKEYSKIFFWNLIVNAIKYNKEWWNIEISINKNSIIIKDSWIWIKQENIKKIWWRFYQENEARWNGFGIWLSLVKKIWDLYKWNIKVESDEGKWTTITINF